MQIRKVSKEAKYEQKFPNTFLVLTCRTPLYPAFHCYLESATRHQPAEPLQPLWEAHVWKTHHSWTGTTRHSRWLSGTLWGIHHADRAKRGKRLVVAKTDSRVLNGKNTISHTEESPVLLCVAQGTCVLQPLSGKFCSPRTSWPGKKCQVEVEPSDASFCWFSCSAHLVLTPRTAAKWL